jgi:hypothetical protein
MSRLRSNASELIYLSLSDESSKSMVSSSSCCSFERISSSSPSSSDSSLGAPNEFVIGGEVSPLTVICLRTGVLPLTDGSGYWLLSGMAGTGALNTAFLAH